MTIETKLSWNERGWYLDKITMKATCALVYEIMINCYSYHPTIRYRVKRSDGPVLAENEIFLTKEELLNSL